MRCEHHVSCARLANASRTIRDRNDVLVGTAASWISNDVPSSSPPATRARAWVVSDARVFPRDGRVPPARLALARPSRRLRLARVARDLKHARRISRHDGGGALRQPSAHLLQERGVPGEDRCGGAHRGRRRPGFDPQGDELGALRLLLRDVQASLLRPVHGTEGTLQTAVLAKHLAAALRTQRLERIVLSQAANDRSKLSVQLECGRVGLTKTYGLHCVTDAEHLKATIDPARCRETGHAERAWAITLAFSERTERHHRLVHAGRGWRGRVQGPSRGAAQAPPARNLRLSSFADPNAPPGQALQTSISLDTAETPSLGTSMTARTKSTSP